MNGTTEPFIMADQENIPHELAVVLLDRLDDA
jgi:hypothetical protein